MTNTLLYLLKLVFRFLRGIILAYGLWCLCLATAWLWPFLLVWILSRLLRRSLRRYRQAATPPPLPVFGGDDDRSPSNDMQSFAA